MERTVYAKISVDDEQAINAGEGTLEYLEAEFGWMQESGISLEASMLADTDDSSTYARYLGYLLDWALNQPSDPEPEEIESPKSYEEFLKEI